MVKSTVRIPNYIILLFISCFYLFFAITSCLEKSATYDEGIILSSGNNFLRNRNNVINAENPVFLKSLLALPTLFMDIKQPKVEKELIYSFNMVPGFDYGRHFLYGNNPELILLLSRLINILITLAGGVFVYLLTRLYMKGSWSILGFALFLFCPNILANSTLGTVDTGVAVFMLAADYFFLLGLRKARYRHFVLTGIFTALSMLSKFSGLLIWIIMLIQFLLYSVLNRKLILRKGLLTMLSGLICLVIINLCYLNWHFTDMSRIRIESPWLLMVRDIPLIKSYLPLPQDYVMGFDILAYHNQPGYPNVYMGKYYPEGGRWFDYYLLACLFKIPVPLLLLLAVGFVYSVFRYWRKTEFYYLLAFACVVLFVFSFMTYRQLGIRYILPAFPFFVLAAVIGLRALFSKLKFRFTCFLLMIWFVVESCIIAYPNYLAYFNEFVGGPTGGKRYFSNSDIDWGQDVPGLKKWLVAHGNPRIYFLYVGQTDLDYYGIVQSADPEYIVFGVAALYSMGEDYYTRILPFEPVANIGNSIYIYTDKINY